MDTSPRRQNGVKKRSPNACIRCRQQKIKCSGSLPCQPCLKRRATCSFDDSTKKILVTKGFIRDLQERAHQPEGNLPNSATTLPTAHQGQNEASRSTLQEDVSTWLGDVDDTVVFAAQNHIVENIEVDREGSSSPSAQLMNPLAVDDGNYMADRHGQPIHLGTSSNWSFGRRILRMTCERLKIQLPTDRLHFEGSVYNLDWQDLRAPPQSSTILLPSADHAMFLINTVKFHLGQMFHLFDDESFMRYFTVFHDNQGTIDSVPRLWYFHYLLIIAFGKAFSCKNNRNNQPLGVELVFEAMRHLPEVTFFPDDRIEAIEILICAALYLQCLDFRNVAYNLIGQGLRKALEQGMHTKMSSQDLSPSVVDRCRKVWWTIYMLDRQMSSLMGLPLAIRDQDISATLPRFSNASQKTVAFELHVKLSTVIADILNTVYSTEGRTVRRYLSSTKEALKSIANVTTQLKENIELPDRHSLSGIGRLPAYLHLLHYQCICLTTRPLAYSFLDRRLKSIEGAVKYAVPRGSVRALLKTCIESAQQMLHILSNLHFQGLLESFLPFDLEAVFTSTLILVMATAIDPVLLDGANSWTDIAYSLFDEMADRGNMIAALRKQELQQLTSVLSHVPAHVPPSTNQGFGQGTNAANRASSNGLGQHDGMYDTGLVHDDILNDPIWQDELSADQLMLLANTLDLDGLDWAASSFDASSVPSQGFAIDT